MPPDPNSSLAPIVSDFFAEPFNALLFICIMFLVAVTLYKRQENKRKNRKDK